MHGHPFPVGATLHVRNPLRVVQVPLHRLANAGFEGFGRTPAQIAFNLARVNGVTPVVAGAVLHESDLRFIAAAVGLGAQLVEQRADGVHDLEVGLFVPAADVVGFTQAAGFEHAADGAAVVFHVQPVAHLLAVAIHRQGLAGQGVDDHERDELFGEVVGPVVVAAVGGEHRQAIGVVPGTHQVVAGGLAGAVRAVGFVGIRFGKGGVAGAERAVHLVGADVQKTKGSFLGYGQGTPVGPHRFEQAEGAQDVGLDEVLGAVDGSVHVALGREVDHGPRTVLGQQTVDQVTVTQVALHEDVPRITLETGKVLEVARIGELVEVDYGLVVGGEPVEYEVAADETGAAGDENIFFFSQCI